MKLALVEAKKAYIEQEVPIGCVIVHNDAVISTGYNKRETMKNSIMHAEIEAIYDACKVMNSWRLSNCTLYVTLEPCPMCAGAIINSRISKIVYGTSDKKSGVCQSITNLFELPFNHRPVIISGIMQKECSEILSFFFNSIRKNSNNFKFKS